MTLETATGLRSEQFTQFVSFSARQTSPLVDHINPEGKPIFNLDPTQRNKAREFAQSGVVDILIPARNEMEKGVFAFPGVLDLAVDVVGEKNARNRIFVVDGNSTDSTYNEAERRGVTVVKQEEIEVCLYAEKIIVDFGVKWPLPQGKGSTILSAALFNYLVRNRLEKDYIWRVQHDADVTNPCTFDWFTWFSWVAMQDSQRKYLQIRAAQPERNNQEVMNALNTIQHNSNLAYEYHQNTLSYLKWLLTGHFGGQIAFFDQSQNVSCYGGEVFDDFALHDLMLLLQKRTAQVEIPERCMDAPNTPAKEEAMMAGIMTFLNVLDEYILRKGIRVINMKPKHYKLVNAVLFERETGPDGQPLEISVINTGPGENIKYPIQLDQILPSAAYLSDSQKGYVNHDKFNALAQRIYGKRWAGVDLKQDG